MNRRPTHPGEMLDAEYLSSLGLSVARLAREIRLPSSTVRRLIQRRGRITAGIALRLARFLGTSPDMWLNLENKTDLWTAQRGASGRSIRAIKPRAKDGA